MRPGLGIMVLWLCVACSEATTPDYPTRFTVAPLRLDLVEGGSDTLVITIYNQSDDVMDYPSPTGSWGILVDAVLSKSCTDCPFTLQPVNAPAGSSVGVSVTAIRQTVDTIYVRVFKPTGCLDPPGCTQHYPTDILPLQDVPITITP